MEKVLLINLSPRPKGTSGKLLEYSKEHLGSMYLVKQVNIYKEETEKIIDSCLESKIIIFIGPCYVNTFPANTFLLLEKLTMVKEKMSNQLVYAVIQGGMPYIHTHYSGLQAVSLFCKECGIEYMGGFVLGGGAMMNGQDFSVLPNGKKVQRQFYIFLKKVADKQYSDEAIYKKVEWRLPVIGWRILARKLNKMLRKQLEEARSDEDKKTRIN